MQSYILPLNFIVIFVLSLLVISTLFNGKDNSKANISFAFLFLIVIFTCTINLITFYYKWHQLVFLQISFLAIGYFYGATVYYHVHTLLEIKLPKSWYNNFYVAGIIFIGGLYYLFIDDNLKLQYLNEIINAEYIPYLVLNNFILIISIFYLIKSKKVINKYTINPDDVFSLQKRQKKEWALEFVNYLLYSLVIFFFILVIINVTKIVESTNVDLIVMPVFMLLIYSFIVVRSMMRYKKNELEFIVSQIENQNKIQNERLAISRDLHDNIGSQLTLIISSVDTLKYKMETENQQIEQNLSTISSFAKDAIVELRDTIWAMNSDEITIEELEIRVANFIERAKQASDKIRFSFFVDDNIKDKILNSKQAMNLYRVIQEAITNAIKYSNSNAILINIVKENEKLKIKIEDNGVGFDLNKIKNGNGLINMKSRMEEINGIFTLVSTPTGTIIALEI